MALAVALAAWLLLRGESEAESTLEAFLSAYEARDYQAAARLTDGDPTRVAKALEANVDGLDGATLDASVAELDESDGRATATTSMSWQVPRIGEFAYENPEIRLAPAGDAWRVHWAADVVHPDLDSPGSRLGTERTFFDRASIIDRDGYRMVVPRPVIEIGVIPEKLRDPDAAVATIAAATDADPRTLRRSIRRAEDPGNFVPAITLRTEDFGRVRSRLDTIPGIEFGARELPLAPTREFARSLLGTVGPITAEQLDELGAPYAVGDNVGQFGLQAAYERRLAGTPELRVVTRLADGSPVDTLMTVDGNRGRPLRTTLDADVQAAAERALGDSDDTEALVAVQPSSGDVLAVASRPVDDAFNRAFEGRYPPGSTFKVISTEALLDLGFDPNRIVDCPPTINVGGRLFHNFEGGAAGAVPFRRDFAESCNTAFISLAPRLAATDFAPAGRRFGLGRAYELDVPAFSGEVPTPADPIEQAAEMIGQAEVLVSPLAMAGAAATVVDGRWHAPRLLADDPREAGARLPADVLAELRSLMREVVTSGTGTALAGVAGEPIGKSGTAEFGSGNPPPTDAWFIAGRDDVAVAVLVEDKPSGGEFAAPIAARFLDGL